MTVAVEGVGTPPRNREIADIHFIGSRILIYLSTLLAVSIIGFPLLWMLICSFKPSDELYAVPPDFLPRQWTLQNYSDLFLQTNFPTYFANSLIVAGGATLLSLAVGGLGAYSLSRFRFFGMAAFADAVLVSYMLPEVLIVLPLYIYVVKLGLADTLIALIISNTAFTLPLTLWFMRAYFNAIPASLEESAMVEGCTRLKAMMRVTVPLALPGIVSVGVFTFNQAWNEYLFALIFISSERNKTLPLGLANWIGRDTIYSWGMLLAGAVMVTIPVIVFYLLVQRRLIVGLAEGGAKGD
ncbi:MAG TPA: carbohydrate ABC transporter permease [Dongiaceae bacterium]|jgi:ABC-type glycerol-3-phosphate transport system permease component|nr:carbohydrate ABC transporter permease [Dongiaceae bacterium]